MERDDTIVEKRFLSNSNEPEVRETHNEEELELEVELEDEEEEEALSLCDLPNKEETKQSNKETKEESKSIIEEFDFCSFSKESEMCSADEVFFQGQILPLSRSTTTTTTKSLSRSESMDTYSYSSTGFTSRGSSRSSSIRSHQSSTTSTRYSVGSSVSTPVYKPSSFNNFNSHPSPKPHMKTSRTKNQAIPSSTQKSRTWSLFRLGLLTTPEIVLDDLKHRSINNTNNIKNTKNKNSFQKSRSFADFEHGTTFKSKKKKQGIFEVNGTIFSTCKCSSSEVVTIPSNIGTIERSVGAKEEFRVEERKGTKQQEEGKQSISRHRTSEWLKQLSLESTSTVRNSA